MKILLTGFDNFGELGDNPSRIIVERIEKQVRSEKFSDILTEILPTEFTIAEERIRWLIRNLKPDVVISLGVVSGSSYIRLERVALNVDDARGAPDNAGRIGLGQLIAPDGPIAYWSTLPLEDIERALRERNIPVDISYHAGTYVCNHVFYAARHEVDSVGSDTKCGFIHIPWLPEQVDTSKSITGCLPLNVMLDAIECCIRIVQQVDFLSL